MVWEEVDSMKSLFHEVRKNKEKIWMYRKVSVSAVQNVIRRLCSTIENHILLLQEERGE